MLITSALAERRLSWQNLFLEQRERMKLLVCCSAAAL